MTKKQQIFYFEHLQLHITRNTFQYCKFASIHFLRKQYCFQTSTTHSLAIESNKMHWPLTGWRDLLLYCAYVIPIISWPVKSDIFPVHAQNPSSLVCHTLNTIPCHRASSQSANPTKTDLCTVRPWLKSCKVCTLYQWNCQELCSAALLQNSL